MNTPKVTDEDYINFIIATPRQSRVANRDVSSGVETTMLDRTRTMSPPAPDT